MTGSVLFLGRAVSPVSCAGHVCFPGVSQVHHDWNVPEQGGDEEGVL